MALKQVESRSEELTKEMNALTEQLHKNNEEFRKSVSVKYRVYNNDKSACFETTDLQLAYEVRKGADTNCHCDDAELQRKAIEFCEKYSWEEDCTIEIVLE